MANTILNARIILKHGTAEEWAASSLVLLQGELGLDTTSLILKIGDGVHTWTELSPASLSAQEAEKLIQTLGHTHSNKDILDKTDAAFTTDQKLKLAGLSNYSHPASGVAPGTYRSVTVDSLGHVSAGSNPTTLSGYGITDAAAKTHTHTAADIPAVQASAIQGKISLDNLPAAALERCVVVADDNARLKLTNAEVQNGETVKVLSSGLMYLVTDDTHLNAEAGYEVYTAGSAAQRPMVRHYRKARFLCPFHSHSRYGGGERSARLAGCQSIGQSGREGGQRSAEHFHRRRRSDEDKRRCQSAGLSSGIRSSRPYGPEIWSV